MHIYKKCLMGFGLCFFCLIQFLLNAEPNGDHISYTLPTTLKTEWGRQAGNGGEIVCDLIDPKTNRTIGNVLYSEDSGKIKKIALYKIIKKNESSDDWIRVLHGVQRCYHANGKLKAEEPFNEDVMDGVFKHWDDQGRLIGCYKMHKGSGIKQIYYSNGYINQVETYVDSLAKGLVCHFYDNGIVCSIGTRRIPGGNYFFTYSEIGQLTGYCYLTGRTDFIVKYDTIDKNFKTISIQKEMHRISEDTYIKMRSQNPDLPQIELDEKAFMTHYRKEFIVFLD